MLYNLPFVPGKRYPFSRVQIGSVIAEAGSFEVAETIHLDEYFTSGHGGGTLTSFKGFTVSGTIEAYVPQSSGSPHTISSNLPGRFERPVIRLWTGGFYCEGTAALSNRSVSAAAGRFTAIKLDFKSHGYWTFVPNVVEAS
ncbi:hypothetical protein GC170_14430 [bacterium]|nr:hypothetical protein [bacterium]